MNQVIEVLKYSYVGYIQNFLLRHFCAAWYSHQQQIWKEILIDIYIKGCWQIAISFTLFVKMSSEAVIDSLIYWPYAS